MRRAALRLVLVWAGLLLAGWALGALVVAVDPRFDLSIVRSLHAAPSGTVTDAWRDLTWLGSPAWLDLVFAVTLAGLLLTRRWRAAAVLTLASPGAVLLTQLTRVAVGRARPPGSHLTPSEGMSWPSGHAAETVALYGALLLLALPAPALRGRRVRVAVCVVVVVALALIGVSRVVLGVHYPSDVIAGWLMSAGWLAALRANIGPAPRDRPRSTDDDGTRRVGS